MYNILYVEDDESLLYPASFFLESRNLSVSPVSNNTQAIKTFLKTKPDLVIMDICLGNSPDGFELASIIKTYRNVPIIFATGRTDDEVIERIDQYDNSGYISKPFRLQELYYIVNGHLQQYERQNQQNITILGNTEFHFDENNIVINGIDIHLRPKECAILKILVDNENKCVNIDIFHDKVWNDLNHRLKAASIYDTISRLKKLLKPDNRLKIVNVNSVGWKLVST